jgi:glucuronoarabinoxylan endo-1,4-beta-xylanase
MKPLHYLKQSFCALVVCAGACFFPAKAQTGICTIDAATNFQTIDGFGFCSAWSGQMTSAQAAILFGFDPSLSQLGFSLLRVRIDSGGSASWGAEAVNAQFAHNYGATVLGTPWSPPASMKSNSSISGGSLNTSSYPDYATYLGTAVTTIKLDYVSMQNEPDLTSGSESCGWTGAQMDAWCQQNAPAVDKPIVMPEASAFSTAYSAPTLNDPVACGNVSFIAGHLYGPNGVLAPFTYGAALNAGKHVWMTEHLYHPTDIGTCMTIAKEVSDCMNNQFSAYIWFWGFYSASDISLISGTTPNLKGYTLGQFAKYIRPGYVRCSSTYNPNANVYVTAYHGLQPLVSNNYQMAIVAVNTGTTSVNQTFSLQNVSLSSFNATQTTSAGGMVSVPGGAAVSNGSFTYTLPAQSVTTFYTGPSSYAALTPACAVLAPSQTEPLAITGTDANGNPLPTSSFTWAVTAGGGTVSSMGLYTAPSTATTAIVTATKGSIQLAATVNVAPTLVHEWTFDAGSGTTAADSVGTANATLTGATWASGAFNGGLAFTGTNTSYGSIPGIGLNSNTVTITGWICPSDMQNYATGLVFNRTSTTSGLDFGPQNNTLELGYMWNGNSATSNWNSGLTVPANQWTFVALVITPTNATIYMQPQGGVMQSATNPVANPAVSFSGVTLLGGDTYATSRYFNGKMDNVCIYNTSLNSSQVAALAAVNGGSAVINPVSSALTGGQTEQLTVSGNGPNGLPVTQSSFTWAVTAGGGMVGPTGLYTAPATVTTAIVTATDGPMRLSATISVTGLAHEWNLEDGNGTVAADSVGTDNATLTGTTWTTGEFGEGVAFAGTSSSYGSIPAMNLNSNTVTISGWINRNGTQNASSGIVFSRASSNVSGVNFGAANELRYCWNGSGSTYNWNSGLVVPNGVWTFFALVVTPTNATMYMQPAGGTMQSATNAVANTASSFNNVTLLGGDSYATTRYFKGMMDDVRISNASLTATQVAMLADLADDWDFNEGSGTTAVDSGPGGHTGTVTGATWGASEGLVFNGTSSNVTFGTGPSLNGQTDFTVSAWVQTTATAAGTIIQQRDPTTNGYLGEYQVLMNSNGTVGFWVFGPESGYQWANTITTTTVINDGNWHLVTAVRHGVAGYIYIDGTLAASITIGTLESLSNTISVSVGADIRDLDAYFNGTIDEVQIYNQALTAAQIAQLSTQ